MNGVTWRQAAALAVVWVAGGGWLAREILAWRAASRAAAAVVREAAALAGAPVAPTAENAAAAAAEVEKWRHLAPAPETGPAAPAESATAEEADRTAAYFALEQRWEALRERAWRQGVAVARAERFGFDAFAHAIPPEEDPGRLLRQAAVAEVLVGELIDARPREIRGVVRLPAAAGESSSDRWRIEFRGGTATLRTFLGRLAAHPERMSVEAVHVEREGGRAAGRMPARQTTRRALDGGETMPAVGAGDASREVGQAGLAMAVTVRGAAPEVRR